MAVGFIAGWTAHDCDVYFRMKQVLLTPSSIPLYWV